MNQLLFIFLQPDPSRWGDPDELPISQYSHELFFLAIIIGVFMIGKSIQGIAKDQKSQ